MRDPPREGLKRTPSGIVDSEAVGFGANGVYSTAARPELLRVSRGQYDGFSPPGCQLFDPGDRHDDQPLLWGQVEARAT